jgi:hypothetical protein
LRQAIVERFTSAPASSSLPTLTTAPRNMFSPSMQKWPAHRAIRARLPTLMASHPEGLRDREGYKLFPTLTATSYGTNRGGAAGRTGPVRQSLHGLAGGSLNPRWCEWFMGFPEDWTVLRSGSPRSATP